MILLTIATLGRVAIIPVLLLALISLGFAASFDQVSHSSQPVNEDQAIVLPGFTPIEMQGTVATLYERSYAWKSGYFPNQIKSRGEWLAKNMRLVATIDGREIVFQPDELEVVEKRPDRIVMRATGKPVKELQVIVESRVEYDGVAFVTLTIIPDSPVTLDGLDFVVDIKDSPSMQVLGFRADGIRRQKDRDDLLSLPYAGPFVNALGFADGERSFWWFADNAEGWIWNGDTVTEIRRNNGKITLRNRLIGSRWQLKSELRINFNFLATPVRELGNVGRGERVAIGPVSKRNKQRNEKFKLWWAEAFAYDAFPYTSYPAGTREKLPKTDINAYPGLEANRRRVKRDRELYGVEWMPYTSLHVLSTLDPVLAVHRREWELVPPKIFRDGLNPYSDEFDKLVLTHRAKLYSDHLLGRLSEEIDNLGVSGFYFDHGPPMDSKNPNNGAWKDFEGRVHGSLDILGIRNFLKELREVFYRKGLAGYLFVHNSNREVIPAYTFATALVDGEQYRSRLKKGDYIGAVSINEFRTRFAPHQYGIPIIWLAVEGFNKKNDPSWPNSERQRRAYRNMQAMALLHDVPDWAQGAHQAERNRLLAMLDKFGVADAEFVGYWNKAVSVTSNTSDVKISTYRNQGRTAVLAIVTNLSRDPRRAEVLIDTGLLGLNGRGKEVQVSTPGGEKIAQNGGRFQALVQGRDFRLFVIEAN
ncbi:MAG TPA: hypothetical protein ENI62_00465 [Gammaproteobacteria bacterium]|nr:hypothetical protein [Gammaproteobacteria bacterium]